MSMSPAQKQAIMIVPRVTASFSFLGSAFILYSVIKGVRSNQRSEQPGRSLLLGASFADLLSSLMYMIGTAAFPTPKGNGNSATCNAQAFFVQFQVGAAIYSGFLGWHYCLFIKYRWRQQQLRLFETVAHATVWLFVLAVGIGSLVEGLYKPHWIRCYYGSKGKAENAYMWAFFFAPIWTSMVCGTFAMLLIYWQVKHIEGKSSRYRLSGSSFTASGNASTNFSLNSGAEEFGALECEQPTASFGLSSTSSFFQSFSSGLSLASNSNTVPKLDLPKTRRVAYQGLGYSAAFLLTYLFPTASRIIQSAGGVPPYVIRILAVSMVSSQGFWNCLVHYFQPKLVARWERQRAEKQRKEELERKKRRSIVIQNLNNNEVKTNQEDEEVFPVKDANGEVKHVVVESSITFDELPMHNAKATAQLQEKQAEIDQLANLVKKLELELKDAKNGENKRASMEQESLAVSEPVLDEEQGSERSSD